MSQKSSETLVRWAYFDIVNDINATIVMSQIHYWYLPDKRGRSKLRAYKQGRFWIAKNHHEWRDETRLTKRQIDRALKILCDAHLIRIVNFRFNGLHTRHIICDVLTGIELQDRPDIDIAKVFNDRLECPQSTYRDSESTSDVSSKYPEVLCLTENTTEITTENTLALQATPQLLTEEENNSGEEEMGLKVTRIGGKTSAEIVQSIKERQEEEKDKMYTAWASIVPKHHPEIKFVPPFLVKQHTQMKKMAASWGDEAIRILSILVVNWTGFGKFVKDQTGAKEYPRSPNLDYLFKHHTMALNFVVGLAKDRAQAKDSVQLTAPKPRGKIVIKRGPTILQEVGLEREEVETMDQSVDNGDLGGFEKYENRELTDEETTRLIAYMQGGASLLEAYEKIFKSKE